MDGPAVFFAGRRLHWPSGPQVGLAGFRLKTMAVPRRGVAVPSVAWPACRFGMSWGADGIVFGQRRSQASCASPRAERVPVIFIVPVKPGKGDALSPQILPGGRGRPVHPRDRLDRLTRWDTAQDRCEVAEGRRAGETKRVARLQGRSDARYIPKTGHLCLRRAKERSNAITGSM